MATWGKLELQICASIKSLEIPEKFILFPTGRN